MAYSLACADLGKPCPGAFTTESSEELWEHVALHAQRSHPDLEMTPETMQAAQALVKEVPG